MEQYIIKISKQVWKNLKKFWWIGLICLVLGAVFIGIATLKNVESNDSLAQMEQPEDVRPLLGSQSMLKYNWDFSETEKSEIYAAQVADAKEKLAVISTIANTADFRSKINELLKQEGMEILTSEDIISVGIISYDVLQIAIYGYDAEKILKIDEIVRSEVERISHELYTMNNINCIVNPIVVYVDNSSDLYLFTHEEYVNEEDSSNNIIKEETDEKNYQIFTFKNVVIMLSAIVLYFAIIVLITITDEKILGQEDNNKPLN